MVLDPISLIVWVLVFALVFWLAVYIVRSAFPASVHNFALAVIGVLALLVLLNLLVGYYPLPRWPR